MPDLPTVPPHVIDQLKVIVGLVASVPPERVDLLVTVLEIGGKPTLHVSAEVDGRKLSPEQEGLLQELLSEATAAADQLAEIRPITKILKDIQ